MSTRTVDLLAYRQLAAWEEIAKDWPLYSTEDGYDRCKECTLAVFRVIDSQGKYYEYSNLELLALTVAHLRNHHPDLDPCQEIVLCRNSAGNN